MRKLVTAVCLIPVITIGVAVVTSQPKEIGVELLVYDQDHWTESFTIEQLKAKGITQAQYDARDQRGDIIEIHEYPYWSKMDPSHWGGHAFRVVVVKNMTIAEAKALHWGQQYDSGKRQARVVNLKTFEIETKNSTGDITVLVNSDITP